VAERHHGDTSNRRNIGHDFGVRAILVGAVFLIAASTTGCTTGADAVPVFSLAVVNDLSQSVVVKSCTNGDSCNTFTGTTRLAPGHSLAIGQWPDGILRPVRLTTIAGTTIGCLPIQFHREPEKDAHVNASQAVPCGSSGGSEAVGGGDWPYPKD
jgi:hypothetical protein